MRKKGREWEKRERTYSYCRTSKFKLWGDSQQTRFRLRTYVAVLNTKVELFFGRDFTLNIFNPHSVYNLICSTSTNLNINITKLFQQR